MKIPSLASLVARRALAPFLVGAGLAAAPLHAQDTTAAADARPVLPVDRVVAIVGDQPILMSQVQEVIFQRRAQGLQLPSDSAGLAELARRVITELVDEELLLAKAKQEAIELTDEELTQQVERQIKSVRDRFRTEREYRDALRQNGLGTPEEYRRSLFDQARRSGLQQRVLDKMRQEGKVIPGTVTEKDITEAFEQNRGSLPRRPAMVGFRQIVVATEASRAEKERARAKAESLLVELRKGGDFEQVAKRESMDQSNREVGGDLGWIRRGVTVPEFERWAFGLQPGVLSPVVETSFGYHIIRVDRVQPAEVKVRHILIQPQTDSADVVRAREKAETIAAAWRAGASYDSLATLHHDQAGGEEKILPEFDRAQLPESYQQAFTGHGVNDIVGPFQIANPRGAPKQVVAQLTVSKEGGDYTVADLRQTIRDQLAQERGIRRFLDSLRRQMFVRVMFDEADVAADARP